MAEKNNANIGFEKQIWDAACVLWGHIPAAVDDAVTTVMCQCELWADADNVMSVDRVNHYMESMN